MNGHVAAMGAWKILLICAIGQNIALGIGYGSFGPLIASSEEHFGISRLQATLGMSVMSLAIGVFTMILGAYLSRFSTRNLMAAASVISALAYCGLTISTSFTMFLFLYLVIGFGMCVVGVLGPITLINRWYETDRGKKLGIVNLPIMLFLVPALVAEGVQMLGRDWVLNAAAVIFLVLAIAQMLLVVDTPEAAGTTPWRGQANSEAAVARRFDKVRARDFAEAVRGAPFWLISIGIGIVSGGASAYFVHAVPFGHETGLSLEGAALLLSVYSGVGMLSPLIFGWLADRHGALVALMVGAAGQALAWIGYSFLEPSSYYPLAALFGFNAVASVAMHQMVMSELIKTGTLSKGYGFSYFLKIPFMFLLGPLVALVMQRFGGYSEAFLMMGMVVAVSVILFALAYLRLVRE